MDGYDNRSNISNAMLNLKTGFANKLRNQLNNQQHTSEIDFAPNKNKALEQFKSGFVRNMKNQLNNSEFDTPQPANFNVFPEALDNTTNNFNDANFNNFEGLKANFAPRNTITDDENLRMNQIKTHSSYDRVMPKRRKKFRPDKLHQEQPKSWWDKTKSFIGNNWKELALGAAGIALGAGVMNLANSAAVAKAKYDAENLINENNRSTNKVKSDEEEKRRLSTDLFLSGLKNDIDENDQDWNIAKKLTHANEKIVVNTKLDLENMKRYNEAKRKAKAAQQIKDLEKEQERYRNSWFSSINYQGVNDPEALYLALDQLLETAQSASEVNGLLSYIQKVRFNIDDSVKSLTKLRDKVKGIFSADKPKTLKHIDESIKRITDERIATGFKSGKIEA